MSTTQNSHGVRAFAHVGIIVGELESAARLFRDRLGAEVQGPEDEPELGLRILWVRVGGVLLEFVAPASQDSRAAAAIARGESGVHHVALEVDGLDELLGELSAAGVPVRDTTPRLGSHGSRISFLDPAASGGALIELMEHPEASPR
ncbi:MAG TPA: VOC family protein [Solirubrobacteraceae bacterium]|nr:VOC family protein [Solirubrobacteraceae bacterium]